VLQYTKPVVWFPVTCLLERKSDVKEIISQEKKQKSDGRKRRNHDPEKRRSPRRRPKNGLDAVRRNSRPQQQFSGVLIENTGFFNSITTSPFSLLFLFPNFPFSCNKKAKPSF
jgi:hypothetical protein